MAFKPLPEELVTQAQSLGSDTPTKEILKTAVLLGKARETGYDTFVQANHLRDLVTQRGLNSDDALQSLIALEQANKAGAATGAGLFTLLRDMPEEALGQWMQVPGNLLALARALEDMVAVVGSPGVIAALGVEVARIEAAIGTDPEKLARFDQAREAYQRIAQVFKALRENREYWDDPAGYYRGLEIVAAAAKNQQFMGDKSAMLKAVMDWGASVTQLLQDPDALTALCSNPEALVEFVESEELMRAAIRAGIDYGSKELFKNNAFIQALISPGKNGPFTAGLEMMIQQVTNGSPSQQMYLPIFWKAVFNDEQVLSELSIREGIWPAFIHNSLIASSIANSELAMQTLVNSSSAMGAFISNLDFTGSLADTTQEFYGSDTAMKVLASVPALEQVSKLTTEGVKRFLESVWSRVEASEDAYYAVTFPLAMAVMAEDENRQDKPSPLWGNPKFTQALGEQENAWVSYLLAKRGLDYDRAKTFDDAFSFPTVRDAIWAPQILLAFADSAGARRALASHPEVYRRQFMSIPDPELGQVLIIMAEIGQLDKGYMSFKDIIDDEKSLAAVVASEVALKMVAMSPQGLAAIAGSDAAQAVLFANNAKLQAVRNLMYDTVTAEKSGFIKYYGGEQDSVAVLNGYTRRPKSIVFAALGYWSVTSGSSSMLHRDKTYAARNVNDAGKRPATLNTISAVSFHDATFTEEADGHAYAEVWELP